MWTVMAKFMVKTRIFANQIRVLYHCLRVWDSVLLWQSGGWSFVSVCKFFYLRTVRNFATLKWSLLSIICGRFIINWHLDPQASSVVPNVPRVHLWGHSFKAMRHLTALLGPRTQRNALESNKMAGMWNVLQTKPLCSSDVLLSLIVFTGDGTLPSKNQEATPERSHSCVGCLLSLQGVVKTVDWVKPRNSNLVHKLWGFRLQMKTTYLLFTYKTFTGQLYHNIILSKSQALIWKMKIPFWIWLKRL